MFFDSVLVIEKYYSHTDCHSVTSYKLQPFNVYCVSWFAAKSKSKKCLHFQTSSSSKFDNNINIARFYIVIVIAQGNFTPSQWKKF